MAYVRVTRTLALPVTGAAGADAGRPVPIGAAAQPEPGQQTAEVSVAGTAIGGLIAQPWAWAAAYGSILVGWVIGSALFLALHPQPFQASAGFDALAAFYIVAQGLERLFEPASNFIRGTVTTAAGGAEGAGGEANGGGAGNSGGGAVITVSLTRQQAVARLDNALAVATTSSDHAAVADAVTDAATAKAAIDQIRANAALLVWGGQAGLAMIFSGAFGLFLLRGVGAAGVPEILDIVITGIAVGGGSKALHDLIKSVQVAKEEKQDPVEAGGAR